MFVNSSCVWYNKNMEKNIFNINNNGLSYGRGYVYSLQYHLVWCTKYRKKVLKDGIDAECKKMLYDQDHEGEHCPADVSCASGTEEGTLGRASVESILLCSNCE